MTDLAPPPLTPPPLLARAMPAPGLRLGVGMALLLLLVGFISIVWTPWPVETLDLPGALADPSLSHLLGTDQLGRDVLSLIMKGILTSCVVAAVALGLGLFIGVPLGLAASRWGRWGTVLVVGSTEFVIVLSALLIAVLLTAIFGPGTINAMFAIGLFNAAVLARVTRDLLLPYRGLDHIAASRLAGLGGWDLMRLHVLPGLMPLLFAAALTQLAFGILMEAALSYVGLASQPPGTSLGLLLKDAQGFMSFKPLLVVAPGLALLLVTLSINLAAAALRGGRNA